MTDSAIKLPNYPALSAALVVDSRLSSKNELQKDVAGTSLFLEVKTAESLATAKLTLELESIDVLVIGPYLRPAAAEALMAWAKENSRLKECAFVVVSETKPEKLFIGAHCGVWKPLNKAKLFDGIVRAVLAVNEGSPWSAIFKNSGFHKQFDSDVISPLLASSAKREVSENALKSPEAILGITHLLKASPEEVRAAFIERNLIFDSLGDPTNELRAAAITFIDSLFPAGLSGNERFMKLCTKAVYSWFENATLVGIKEANEQLKISIWQFKG
jgi:hypothetical protein